MLNTMNTFRIKTSLRIFTLCLLFLFNSIDLKAQSSEPATPIGIYPISNKDVNGVMLNFFPKFKVTKNLQFIEYYKPRTNGIELNLNPLGPLVVSGGVAMTAFDLFQGKTPRIFRKINSRKIENVECIRRINGLCISTSNFESTLMNGIELSFSGSNSVVTNGITISPFYNYNGEANGLSVGLVGNNAGALNGAQIGLFNRSSETKGLQIGLWNKNEKRSLPFINWNF